MKRQAITLEDIAARDNLLLAVTKAVRGKRGRPSVQRWLGRLEAELAALARGILEGTLPAQPARSFVIHDPKTRLISAAPLTERVLQHALFNLAEPRLERMLVPSSFACRPGKGVHAAVRAVQQGLRLDGWWLQMDVAGCFAGIHHLRLLELLARRFKGGPVLDLMARIVRHGMPAGATRGLPIGALASQHFANAYLDAADRWLLARPDVRSHVRYMDDIVVGCASRADAVGVFAAFAPWLAAQWGLELKPPRIGPNLRGIAFCGFRVKRGCVLPSARKLARFRAGARRWQRASVGGANDAADLLRAHDVLEATLAHTQSLRFRRRVWAQAGGFDDPADMADERTPRRGR